MHIHSDFDGTIARCDVTDLVLQAFATPEWEAIEEAWQNGIIDAATCMRRQIRLIDASPHALDELLDSVAIDPGFPDFVAWCASRNIPLTVVSDGVDYFIRRILQNHGLVNLPVFANALVRDGRGLRLEHPWRSRMCAAKSGVCKCEVTSVAPSLNVYVGDGRSDECVAATADLLFAKDNLATYCTRANIPFIAFESFHDVRRSLGGVVKPLDVRPTLSAARPGSI